jgi:hypothetical protein
MVDEFIGEAIPFWNRQINGKYSDSHLLIQFIICVVRPVRCRKIESEKNLRFYIFICLRPMSQYHAQSGEIENCETN